MEKFLLSTFSSIKEVSKVVWDSFVDNSRISMQYDHLHAIEQSRINDHKPHYITVYDNTMKQYVGVAYFIAMDMDVSKSADDLKPESVEIVKQWFPNFLKLKMIECGLLTGTGQCFAIKEGYESEVLPLIIDEIEKQGKELDVDFVLYRDVNKSNFSKYNGLFTNAEYSAFNGYASTPLNVEWNTFDDYLKDLSRKKRRDITKAKRQLQQPGIVVEKLTDITANAEKLASLWKEVSDNSVTYSHEMLTPEYFISLEKNFGANIDVFVVKRCEEIISFGICYEGDKEYFLLYTGFNVSENRKYALYFNNYYIAMEEAIRKGKKVIDMGVTTYDVKLKLGASTTSNAYFTKYLKNPSKSFTLASFLEDGIIQPEKKYTVFKEKKSNREEIAPLLVQKQYESNDIFGKTDSFHRINLLELMGIYSFFPEFESAQTNTVSLDGKDIYMFGSNSYLGLANDSRVIEASVDATRFYGSGCSGSPLMNGTLDIHNKLTAELKALLNKEDCILYSTGYQTNLGVVSALANASDLVILDEYSHASLIDGSLLSKAKIARYRHNNMAYLDKMLQRFPDKRKLVISDSVFSMKGTVVDLPELVRVCKKHNARLVLDEAHAVGVYGPNGGGIADYYGLSEEVDVITGTFSKSCASIGGFVAGNQRMVDYLRYNSRSHIFSASLPPSATASVLKSLEIIKNEPRRRQNVVQNAKKLATALISLGYEADFNNTAIIPVYCRDEIVTLALFKKLTEMGVYVNPVLSPGVPKGEELLRLSCLATHTDEDLEAIINVFKQLKTFCFPLKREQGQLLFSSKSA